MIYKYLLCVAFVLARCGIEALEIPNNFFMDTPRTYLCGDDIINLQAENTSFGFIKRHISGSIWTRRIPQYDLYSPTEGYEAVAKVASSDGKYRVIFSVKDKHGQSIGKVEENWEDTFIYYNPTIEIYSVDQELLAIVEGNYQGNSLTLFDPKDRHIFASVISGGLFLLGNWNVLIEDTELLNRIDPRLLILSLSISADRSFHYKLAGYQTSSLSESLFKSELKQYEEQLKGIEPTAEDIEFTRSFIESLLIQERENIDPKEDLTEKELKVLMLLLEDNVLDIYQKSALLQIMR